MTHTEAVNSLASERYLLDEMPDPERDAFEAHFFDCPECAEDVTAGARMRDGVEAGLVAHPQIARVAAFTPAQKPTAGVPVRLAQPWYRSAALPWAVAATLAVMVGYQAQQPAVPGMGLEAGAAETLAPVLLRPASRGAVPVVRLEGSTHAALALDVDAAGATEVSYDVLDGAGAVVTRGRGPAPAAGAPLLVVIPTFTLKAEQRYSLTVRDAAAAARTLGEYQFATIR